tara:strand:- start:1047 stop:1211 length:165 start_codon:yes stop_codon:yes gene_type:complete
MSSAVIHRIEGFRAHALPVMKIKVPVENIREKILKKQIMINCFLITFLNYRTIG